MNKHTRLIVSLLFAVIIILAAAIIKFYVSVPDNTLSTENQAEIVRTFESDSYGNVIFSDGRGGFGIANSGKIIVSPEWHELAFADDEICMASKKISGKLLYGCIDFEGNIILPFIYSSITKYTVGNFDVYCAESYSDGSYVLYNKNFMPLFRQSWISCSFGGEEIVLADKAGIYTYSVSSDEILFKTALLSGDVMGFPYNLNIYSRVLLSKISVPMIEQMVYDAGKYLEYSYTEKQEAMSSVDYQNIEKFVPLFKNDERIISKKLLGISDMHIYAIRPENGMTRYEVSVTADTEITYTDDSGEINSLRDEYKSSVIFSGNSETNLYAVSGKSELDSPEYPEPPKDEDETDGGNEEIFTDE